MTEFEFLKKMFQRLSEAEIILHEAKKDTKNKIIMAENLQAMASCSIKDYLQLRYQATPVVEKTE